MGLCEVRVRLKTGAVPPAPRRRFAAFIDADPRSVRLADARADGDSRRPDGGPNYVGSNLDAGTGALARSELRARVGAHGAPSPCRSPRPRSSRRRSRRPVRRVLPVARAPDSRADTPRPTPRPNPLPTNVPTQRPTPSRLQAQQQIRRCRRRARRLRDRIHDRRSLPRGASDHLHQTRRCAPTPEADTGANIQPDAIANDRAGTAADARPFTAPNAVTDDAPADLHRARARATALRAHIGRASDTAVRTRELVWLRLRPGAARPPRLRARANGRPRRASTCYGATCAYWVTLVTAVQRSRTRTAVIAMDVDARPRIPHPSRRSRASKHRRLWRPIWCSSSMARAASEHRDSRNQDFCQCCRRPVQHWRGLNQTRASALCSTAAAAAPSPSSRWLQHIGVDNHRLRRQHVLQNGGTYTGQAITYAQDSVLDGARAGAQQLMIVLTDGQSADVPGTTADNARAAGITVFAVGVSSGSDSDYAELESIGGSAANVFSVSSFSELSSIVGAIAAAVCELVSTRLRVPILAMERRARIGRAPVTCCSALENTYGCDCGGCGCWTPCKWFLVCAPSVVWGSAIYL